MQSKTVISTKELRDNLSEILEKVAIGRQSFVVAKFGRQKALITPVVEPKKKQPKKNLNLRSLPAFGMWKDRGTTQEILQEIRQKAWVR